MFSQLPVSNHYHQNVSSICSTKSVKCLHNFHYQNNDPQNVFHTSSIKKKVKKGSGSKTLPSNSPVRGGSGPESPGARRVEPTEALGTAVVKYNYQAQQPDELSLTKGTRILILEKSNDGWWRGQYQGHTGWWVAKIWGQILTSLAKSSVTTLGRIQIGFYIKSRTLS